MTRSSATARMRRLGLNLPNIAARLFDTPLALQASKLETIMSVLGPRFGLDEGPGGGIQAFHDDFDFGSDTDSPIVLDRPDIAVIPVTGTLVHQAFALEPPSLLMSYTEIADMFTTAIADPTVTAIVFDIDSPGGEVNGLFALVDTIHAARGEKPMLALVDELATSAAYAIASAADRIVIPRTGDVGSIGSLAVHVDQSRRDESEGFEFTFIASGARKTDGNVHEPLAPAARRRIEAEVDRLAEILFATVARNRGLDIDAVRDQEAAVFSGPSARAVGLADDVMDVPAALEAFVQASDRNRLQALADRSRPLARLAESPLRSFFILAESGAPDFGARPPARIAPSDSAFAVVREDRSRLARKRTATLFSDGFSSCWQRARNSSLKEKNEDIVYIVGRKEGTDESDRAVFVAHGGFRWQPERETVRFDRRLV